MFDKSKRKDGTSRCFAIACDRHADTHLPRREAVRQRQKAYRKSIPLVDEDGVLRHRASELDCEPRALTSRFCSNASDRQIPRSVFEGARGMGCDNAMTEADRTSRREREMVEMGPADLKRVLRLARLRLRGPNGARGEFHLAATAQNPRKLAKLVPLRAPASA